MYGILGEDLSDADTLKVLVRNIAADDSLKIKTKGFDGSGNLLKRGAGILKLYESEGMTHFIVCHDADGTDPSENHDKVMDKVIQPSGISDNYCVVIPVQELEAWILADIQAVTNIFKSWRPRAITNPESIQNPKEHMEKLSRTAKGRPRYAHATHNDRIAKYLDLAKVEKKCPSFKPFADFVRDSSG